MYGGTFEIRCTSKFGAMYLSRNFSCHAMLSAGILTEIHNLCILVQEKVRNYELPEGKSVKLSQK